MAEKTVVLLVVIAIVVAAVWWSAASRPGRDLQSRWLQDRLDAHREFVNAQIVHDLERARPGYAQMNQDAIRRLYRECGSY